MILNLLQSYSCLYCFNIANPCNSQNWWSGIGYNENLQQGSPWIPLLPWVYIKLPEKAKNISAAIAINVLRELTTLSKWISVHVEIGNRWTPLLGGKVQIQLEWCLWRWKLCATCSLLEVLKFRWAYPAPTHTHIVSPLNSLGGSPCR